MPTVDVLIVCYNGKGVIDDCLTSVLASIDPGVTTRITVVDNASTDASADHIAARYPTVALIRSPQNLGFAGGNNLGWTHIQKSQPSADFLFLLNQDTLVQTGFLAQIVAFMDAHPAAGSAQSKILLHHATDTLNTIGNRSHFLGFGIMTAYQEPDRGQYQTPTPIDFASGAAAIVRTSALSQVGLFDDVFFMYLEDADLSWKLKQIGLETWYCPASVVYHKYKFSTDFRHYFHLERNRWWLLLVYYKLATLVLLLPALGVMEAGQWYFALSKGVMAQKFRSYAWFWSVPHLCRLLDARRAAQARRTVPDRLFTKDFTGVVILAQLDSPILRYLVNPVFNAYWKMARRVMWW